MLANVQQVFNDGGGGGAEMSADDVDESLFTSGDMLSPYGQGGSADAQTQAMMLQQQLDVINNEIRSVIRS